MKLETLYKKDTKGRIREWWLEVGGNDETAHVKSFSGIQGGTVKSSITECEPSSTMTAIEVANSKATTAYNSKLKSGYFKTEQEAKDYKPSKVMLLHDFKGNEHKIHYPAIIYPKLDGVCGLYKDSITDAQFRSREDNEFEKLRDHAQYQVADVLTKLFGTTRSLCDAHGELYAHGHPVSEIVEAIKGENPKVLDKLRFYMYDYMDEHATENTYQQRLGIGQGAFAWSATKGEFFLPLKGYIVHNEAEVEEATRNFIQQGFEGSVTCNLNGKYLYDRRTYDKLRKKNIITMEFKIVGILCDKVDGMELIKFECQTEDGAIFPVVPAWKRSRRATAYASGESYIGKLLEVEFRSWTKYGVPFHQVGKEIRDYE